MWVVGRHEKGGVDFEAPGTTLNGAFRWEFGEVAVEQRRGDQLGKWMVGDSFKIGKGGFTGPWKIPSFLCSLVWERGRL